MSRNLVILLDGTANQFGKKNTNVVRLFQALEKNSDRQLRYYDPGVGTIAHSGTLTRFKKRITILLGLGFGLGATQNIVDSYQFLMHEYQQGDRIFLFGFSRGALEARALAAMIYLCGLMEPELDTLLPYAVALSRTAPPDPVAAEFSTTFSRRVGIHFMGLWDTVTSMGNVWSPQAWPHTTVNPSVETVRHAIALDERRSFFRQNRWNNDTKTPTGQNFEELWFTGVHCDVGGGYEPNDGVLWTIPYLWLCREAERHGLLLKPGALDGQVAEAREAGSDQHGYRSAIHNSMMGLGLLWPIAEFVPKSRKTRVSPDSKEEHRVWNWPPRYWLCGWILRGKKMGNYRLLKEKDRIHASVLKRYVEDPDYLPQQFERLKLSKEEAATMLLTHEGNFIVSGGRVIPQPAELVESEAPRI